MKGFRAVSSAIRRARSSDVHNKYASRSRGEPGEKSMTQAYRGHPHRSVILRYRS